MLHKLLNHWFRLQPDPTRLLLLTHRNITLDEAAQLVEHMPEGTTLEEAAARLRAAKTQLTGGT